MNRRSFIRSIAKGVLAAVATVYCPKLLDAPARLPLADPQGPHTTRPGFTLADDWRDVRAYAVGRGTGKTDTDIVTLMAQAMRQLNEVPTRRWYHLHKPKRPVFYASREVIEQLT